MARRAFLFGLDCASPELWFERYAEELPTVSSLRASGSFGPLHSVHPPITVPAWAAMLSGRDPGELGLYGFRGRPSREERRARLHDASDLHAPLLWDLLGQQGRESIVVGFPPSYPPRPLNGHLITGLLTPPDATSWTYPHDLARDVGAWLDGVYAFDTEAHRGDDLGLLRDQVFAMTRARFRVVRELVRTRPWDFGFVHEIGLDRLQHAFWDGLDEPGSEAERTLADYHRLLDDEIGETLEELPGDTLVAIASDHGARKLEGSFALNEWLAREGYLVLREEPSGAHPVTASEANVDWARSRAWADGGYCGRIYLNVRGREPDGALAEDEAAKTRDEIRLKLEGIRRPDGEPLASAVCLPEEVYTRVRGVAPDLLFYPGDLAWRCSETLGHASPFLARNDTGYDVANHSWEGLFVLQDPEREGAGRCDDAHLLDVAPTLCERLGLEVPGWMRGGPLA